MLGAISHFRTITKHRHKVVALCFKAGIPIRGLLHDLSKYTLTEFICGAKFYQGTRSPNEMERETYGYSKAWLHHKGRNRHQFEYWTDYNIKTRCVEPVKMPLKFVIEMFCDRVAASKIYNGKNYTDKTPFDYYDNRRDCRKIHAETAKFLEKLLVMLYEKGEDYTFKYIRTYLKTHKDY